MKSTVEIEQLIKQEITELASLMSAIGKSDPSSNQKYQVLMRNRLNSVKILLNRLEADDQAPVERKAGVLEDVATTLSDVIFMGDLPEHATLTWYEINALRLQIIARLMYFWGKHGSIRMRGLGLALENILLGLRIPDLTPLLTSTGNEDVSERLNKLMVAISLLDAKFQVHAGAIRALQDIAWKDLERWTKEALGAAEELMELLDRHWNMELFYKWGKIQDPDLPFTIMTHYLAVPLNIISFLISVHAMIGEQWPPSLLTSSLVSKGDTEELLATVGSLLRFVEEKIEELITSHVFQKDDQPLKDPLLGFWIHHFWRFQLMHEGITLMHVLQRTKVEDRHVPRFQRLVEKMLELLKARSYLMENPDYLNTTSGELLVETLTWFASIIGYHGLISRQLGHLKEFERVVGKYLQSEGFERFPQFTVLFYLILITVASKMRNTAVMLRGAKKLQQALDHLVFFPRDRLAAALLSHLILRCMNVEDDATFLEHVDSEVQLAYENGVPASTLSIALCLVEKMKKSVQKASNQTQQPCRTYRQHVLDPKSIFVPDLEFLCSQAGLLSIRHEPLNLEADRVT